MWGIQNSKLKIQKNFPFAWVFYRWKQIQLHTQNLTLTFIIYKTQNYMSVTQSDSEEPSQGGCRAYLNTPQLTNNRKQINRNNTFK